MLSLLFTTACEQKKNSDVDNNSNTGNNIEETVEKNLQLDDELVASLIEKVDFKSYVLANLYAVDGFDVKTIPNHLILMMGFNDVKIVCDLRGDDPSAIETVSSSLIDKNIKNIFGNAISYVNQNFNPSRNGLYGYDFYYSAEIKYSDDSYIVSCPAKNSVNPEVATQEFYKATMKGNEIKLYSYIKFSRDIVSSGDCIYRDYDMNSTSDKFSNVVACYDDSFNEVKQGKNEYITFVYTFVKDDSEQYFLNSFQKK